MARIRLRNTNRKDTIRQTQLENLSTSTTQSQVAEAPKLHAYLSVRVQVSQSLCITGN